LLNCQQFTEDSKNAALLDGLGRAAALRFPPLRLLASLPKGFFDLFLKPQQPAVI